MLLPSVFYVSLYIYVVSLCHFHPAPQPLILCHYLSDPYVYSPQTFVCPCFYPMSPDWKFFWFNFCCYLRCSIFCVQCLFIKSSNSVAASASMYLGPHFNNQHHDRYRRAKSAAWIYCLYCIFKHKLKRSCIVFYSLRRDVDFKQV